MKNLIKCASIFLMLLFLLSPNLAAAQEVDTSIEVIPIKELDTLPIEKTYSYEEMLEYMKKEGYGEEGIQEFKKTHTENLKLQKSTRATSSTIRYSRFRLDGFKFTSGLRTYKLQPEVLAGLEYIGSGPSPSRIVSLENPYVYTGGGAACSFDGKLTYKLISGREFYTLMQGNVYKEGKMTVTGGININIGKAATASINASNEGDFLKNISEQETYYSAGLSK